MMLDVPQTDPLTIYHTLVSIVTPRPIAWVTSLDAEGRVNLAPYSFFNTFGGHPPVVVFAPVLKPDGTKKDTLLNVEATGEFVINVAVAELAEQVNLSSKALPRGVSEVELTDLSVVPSVNVKPPRLAESPVQLECVLHQVLRVGEGPGAANLIIGRIVVMHIADTVLDERGRVDPRKLRSIGRLGGAYYCHTSDLFEMQRPT